MCRLQDLGSKNGTRLNGTRLAEAELHHGDLIAAGTLQLRVRLEGPGWTAGPPLTVTVDPVDVSTATDWPQVPGYRTEAELGRGGMGVVYRAVCTADGSLVALKTIPPALLTPTRHGVERFLREIDVLRQLTHPGIVALRDSGETGGRLWFVMEYVAGRDAGALRKAGGSLAVGRVVGWAVQLLDALAFAHGLGIVHRDVKPSNLLVCGSEGAEAVKLADFGLARVYQESALSGLTMIGSAGGTPEYMAPEQALDFRSARPAADLYATAATMYCLLTGKPPFGRCGNLGEMIRKLLGDTPEPPERLRPDLPPGLSAVVMRGLQRKPEGRYPDARAFRRALVPYATP
jgi:serine/threonine-protein kinase